MKFKRRIKYNTVTWKRFVSLAGIILLVCSHLPLYGQGTGLIEGKIMNLTTGKKGHADQIKLYKLSGGMQEVVSRNNIDGDFTIGELDVTARYLLRAEYQGVTYNSSVRFNKDNRAEVTAVVYEKSISAADVSISFPHMMIKLEGDELLINKLFEIQNDKNPKRVFYNESETFRFYLPDDAHGKARVSASTGSIATNQEYIETEEKNIYTVLYPMKPGKTQIEISYNVDYSKREYLFKEQLLYDIETLTAIAFPKALRLEGEQLSRVQTEGSQGITMYNIDSIKKGEIVLINVSGWEGRNDNTAGGQNRIISVHQFSNRIAILFIVLLSAVIAGGIFLSSVLKK